MLLLAGAPPMLLVGGWLLYANPLQSVYETHSDLTPRTDALDVLLRSLNAFGAGNFVSDDLLLAAAALLWKANREVLFWVAWFVGFLAPVLQLIPNLTWVAERYLYMPAIGIFAVAWRSFLNSGFSRSELSSR